MRSFLSTRYSGGSTSEMCASSDMEITLYESVFVVAISQRHHHRITCCCSSKSTMADVLVGGVISSDLELLQHLVAHLHHGLPTRGELWLIPFVVLRQPAELKETLRLPFGRDIGRRQQLLDRRRQVLEHILGHVWSEGRHRLAHVLQCLLAITSEPWYC